MAHLTPMLKQYIGIKGEYPNAILFFRMGDFYEMFFEDAKIASKILGITLTSRGNHNGKKIPMCGIPHHAFKAYIGKLVDKGWKVAICEQTEDPKKAKGIVKREVVRLVTPGSVVDERELDDKTNIYMAAVSKGSDRYGLAHVELSTGEFRVTEMRSINSVKDELARIDPAELLLTPDPELCKYKGFSDYHVEQLDRESFNAGAAETILKEQLGVKSLTGFGCNDMKQGTIAAGALIHYLQHTQKGKPEHIKELFSYHLSDYMILDEATREHLELLKTMRRQSSKGALFQILDKTLTPMGGRLLRRWIAYPLIHLDAIKQRLSAVASLKDAPILRQELREELKKIYDLERLNGKIALGRANARDLLALKFSIQRLPFLKDRLMTSTSMYLSEMASKVDILSDINLLIEKTINEDPPITIKEGGIIREGYDEELDEYILLSRDGKTWITKFAASEQKRVGISSLKVGFNKVFGYYLEISNANLHLVPQDYIRKQTLVNGERFITEALKEKEQQVLGAEEKRTSLEFEIFNRIRNTIAHENRRLKKTSEYIAQIDAITSLAEVAEMNDYVCPKVDATSEIHIKDGRHPVIEQTVKDEDFVPNDIHLDDKTQQLLIITGPNMAGKSTILRQVALTVLMAQMGCFVPTSNAHIGIVDRIFTRVGASDDLAKGQSTFMVEMNETANILRHATPKSLVILDEIGRGTSTYDGLSIAWAVAEALHDRNDKGIRTLFATHYHELTELVATKSRVKNYNIAVRKWKDHIIFLRKLIPGGTSRSYGIEVARIAGVPEGVLKRAKEILDNLEGSELDGYGKPRLANSKLEQDKSDILQLSLFRSADSQIKEWIEQLEIDSITPVEALVELSKIKDFFNQST